MWRRVLSYWSQPVDGASLAVYRLGFGLLLFGALVRFAAKGWVTAELLTPPGRFTHFGLAWVPRLTSVTAWLCFGVMLLTALLLAMGKWQRTSAVCLGVCFSWFHLSDVTFWLNHYHLVSLLLLLWAVVPAVGAQVPRWVLGLFRFQIGIVYFMAGVAKLQPDWLLQAQPLRIWLAANDDFPVLGSLFVQPWAATAMSWGGVVFDLTAVLWLSLSSTRRFFFPVLVAFHLMTAALFQIGLFPWLMTWNALLFFDPAWPRRLFAVPLPVRPLKQLSTVGLLMLGVFVTSQILLPLRGRIWPGNHLWHEQGFRFSWNVMVMEKNGTLELYTVDRETGAQNDVDLSPLVTQMQLKMASTQPDLILQLAKRVEVQARQAGQQVEVHARSMVSLNGRPAQPLIDESVDLTQVVDGIGSRSWVTSLESEATR
jgi:vitamin K-dependent gamma-carboxylase